MKGIVGRPMVLGCCYYQQVCENAGNDQLLTTSVGIKVVKSDWDPLLMAAKKVRISQ